MAKTIDIASLLERKQKTSASHRCKKLTIAEVYPVYTTSWVGWTIKLKTSYPPSHNYSYSAPDIHCPLPSAQLQWGLNQAIKPPSVHLMMGGTDN